jgi:Zn-dependent membrane protease YugP
VQCWQAGRVSSRLKSKFEHYSKMQLQNGMSGAEIAEDAG